jgi:hypothetical protein
MAVAPAHWEQIVLLLRLFGIIGKPVASRRQMRQRITVLSPLKNVHSAAHARVQLVSCIPRKALNGHAAPIPGITGSTT